MNIKIVIPVWGDDYINVLKKVVLPSHFSKGNLPFISINCQVEYVFYTLQEDLKHLNDELSKLNLERFAKVCIKTFRKNHRKNIYALYGNAHKKRSK